MKRKRALSHEIFHALAVEGDFVKNVTVRLRHAAHSRGAGRHRFASQRVAKIESLTERIVRLEVQLETMFKIASMKGDAKRLTR